MRSVHQTRIPNTVFFPKDEQHKTTAQATTDNITHVIAVAIYMEKMSKFKFNSPADACELLSPPKAHMLMLSEPETAQWML